MEGAGKQLTDRALQQAMKDHGLGTPATRASIIETLLARGYIGRNGKQLVPTELGLELIDSLPVPGLLSAELTGTWEARLASLARSDGSADAAAARFLADINAYVRELVDAVRGAPAPGPLAAAPTRLSPPGAARAAAGGRRRSPGRRTTAAKPAIGAAMEPKAPRARRSSASAATAPTKRSSPRRVKSAAAAPSLSARPPRAVAKPSGVAAARSRTLPVAGPPLPPSQRPPPGAAVEPPLVCPRCRRARLLWGRRAWGCADFRTCTLTIPYEKNGRPLSEGELRALCTAARALSRAEASKE
jgi:DNA topoisomerase-3